MNIRWQKFSALGWLEWRVILASLAWLPWCALALRLQGFQRTRDTFLSRCALAQAGTPEGEQLALAQRIARAVNLAARYGPYRANCLKRSLVLCRQLGRHGLQHELMLGAAIDNGDFFAHAWVEHAGNVINDAPDIGERFGTFRPRADCGH